MKKLLKNNNFILSIVCFLFIALISMMTFSEYSFKGNEKVYCISICSAGLVFLFDRFVDCFLGFLDDIKNSRKGKETIKEYEENA